MADKVFDQVDDFDLLKNEFDARYPLAARRFEYFHLTHQENQLFSDFASKLLKQGKEADL